MFLTHTLRVPYKGDNNMARLSMIVLLTLSMVVTTTTVAEEKKGFIQPSEVGGVYVVQGEYVGETIPAKEGDKVEQIGAQLIALGGDKFRGVVYKGGLPGAGWKRGDEIFIGSGTIQDDLTGVFKIEGGDTVTGVFKDGKLIVRKDGKPIRKYTKVTRKSPTLGMKPPENAIVLFDGTEKGAKNFKKGTLVLGNLLQHDCESLVKFGDHKLHIEFRTPFMPYARGQGRGNSGMYIQGRYECQILDSFGLEGKNYECGGIYSIAEPIVNMALPPLTWQTYDVDFTAARYDGTGKKVKNARVTIRHNGVVIHDDLELSRGTPGKYGKGPLYLQGHGNPVVFKNVWAVEK